MSPFHKRPGAIALVADDESLLRMEAADMLADAGFDVLEAGNADAALAYLGEHAEVTLLFTDIEMPGPVDGIALAHEVERRWPHMAIIVCSGRRNPDAGLLPARARFLTKPYSAAMLARTMREVGLC